MNFRAITLVVLAALFAVPQAAKAQSCAHALVLALDVSLSVDTQDFALQREGLARALLDPDVTDAMLHMPGGHVELAVFEWSGQFDQNLLIGWTVIDSPSTLQAVAQDLRDLPQMGRTGRTGIGAAMLYAYELMKQRPNCARHTLDVSGDGPNNSGPAPELIKERMQMAGYVVNALVIENNFNDPEPSASPPLGPYYRNRVITGPASFVEAIFGFDNYEAAIRRKLLRELFPAVAALPK
ncbi:MAG: DUF1194 domain-containing protein [Pseudomonadota bacterium]